MIFVGYEEGSKAYRAYDPRTHRVHITRDVVFDEVAQWHWEAEGGIHGEDNLAPFEFEVITTIGYQRQQNVNQAELEPVDAQVSPPVGERPFPAHPRRCVYT
jgi:hypothetical protein